MTKAPLISKTIYKLAQQTLLDEAAAIVAMSEALEEPTFLAALECIVESHGRLVVTGIGKSAIVGQKIVATLNSTGTPALFMHAADAVHGDLGMITPNDVVLCLSKSGNTAEIKVLVPLIKNFGNKLIAFTADANSFLALMADFVLLTPLTREADPNNLAPTTSTTLQMALGDALATALIALRGFTPENFSRFHPGGALGKQLYLKVSDICSRNERPCVNQSATLHTIILEITSKRLGATVVLDDEEQLLGIITDGDLRRALENHATTLSDLKATDLMNTTPKTIDHAELAVNALSLIREHKISQLIVLKANRYFGIIHLHDLLREGIV